MTPQDGPVMFGVEKSEDQRAECCLQSDTAKQWPHWKLNAGALPQTVAAVMDRKECAG